LKGLTETNLAAQANAMEGVVIHSNYSVGNEIFNYAIKVNVNIIGIPTQG
jgi:hypothetical protein